MRTIRNRAASWLKQAVRSSGFELQRKRDGFHYAPDYYGRSFAMREDIRRTPVFEQLAAEVIRDQRSCLYYDRLYVLFQALDNLRRRATDEPLRVVEVGVYRGGTTAYLARAARALGFARAELHAFDTFEGHAAADIDAAHDTVHTTGLFDDTSFAAVSQYLAQFANVQVHKGRFEDRCELLGDASVSLMHLDVDLYAPTLHALRFASERQAPGSIVIVDDYGTKSCPGVKTAVAEFLADHADYLAFHPLTEQCVLTRVA
jgi:hypothetical protein